jgi:hypothetical protein
MAGGLASVAALLATTVSLNTLADLKKLGISLVVAFLSGGILATEKALRWVEPAQPEPLTNEPNA